MARSEARKPMNFVLRTLFSSAFPITSAAQSEKRSKLYPVSIPADIIINGLTVAAPIFYEQFLPLVLAARAMVATATTAGTILIDHGILQEKPRTINSPITE